MKHALISTVAGIALAAALPAAQAAGHYVPGVEGIQAGSVPPPGRYYLGYLVQYDIDEVSGAPGRNEGSVSALANRFAWITSHKILGADYGVEAIVPLQSVSLTFGGIGYNGTDRGLGDVYLGPVVLGWHGARWDGVFALGQWFDTGDYSASRPSSVGLGYGSTMITLGGTYYPDAQKAWSATALARYEINAEREDSDITPGDGLSVEWGLARRVGGLQLGLVGYYQEQVSDDEGTGAGDLRPRRNAFGLELNYPVVDHGLFLKFAAYGESSASDGATEGSLLRMTLIKTF